MKKAGGGIAALVGLLGGGIGGVSGWQTAEKAAEAIVHRHQSEAEHSEHAPLWQRYNELQQEVVRLRERLSRLEGQLDH